MKTPLGKPVRLKYHLEAFMNGAWQDSDIDRDLSSAETAEIHNAWMNDVNDWMSNECLQQYYGLIDEADAGKNSAGKPGKGKASNKNSAGKPAKGKGGKSKCSAGRPVNVEASKATQHRGEGPRQQAQQLKKQRFNKVISDIF